MKIYRTKANDAKAYGFLKPVVFFLFLLSIGGTIVSFLSEYSAIYNTTEGGWWMKTITALLSSAVLEGGVRLCIFVFAYLLFECFREFQLWKLFVMVIALGLGTFLFTRSLNLSIEGTNAYAENTVQKPDTITANNDGALLLESTALSRFQSDSLKELARIETKFAKIKTGLDNSLRQSYNSLKKYQTGYQKEPNSQWFPQRISATNNNIRDNQKRKKNLSQEKNDSLNLAFAGLRAKALGAKAESQTIQANNQIEADSLNKANAALYAGKLAKKKGEYSKYIWASLLIGLIHSLALFGWLFVSGVEIKYEFTKEDELELPSIRNKIANAVRLKSYNWVNNRFRWLTEGEINIQTAGLSVTYNGVESTFTDNSPTPQQQQEGYTNLTEASNIYTQNADSPAFAEAPLPVNEVQPSPPVENNRPIGFFQQLGNQNETNQNNGSQALNEINHRVGEEFKKVKEWVNQASDNLQAQKEELNKMILQAGQRIDTFSDELSKARNETVLLKNQYNRDKQTWNNEKSQLSQKVETLTKRIIRLEAKTETVRPPVTIAKTTTNNIETVTQFDATYEKQKVKKYIDRFFNGYTLDREEYLKVGIPQLVHHGYEVAVNWATKSKKVSTKPVYQVGEKKAELTIKHDGNTVQDMTINIINA